MRTSEMMRHYEKYDCPMPKDGWQRFSWFAAEMLKTAKRMRNTAHGRMYATIDKPFTQDDLFNIKD